MFLGIDIGTSAVKVVLVDDHGAILHQTSVPLGISRPRPRWSEQAPDDWWAATEAAVLALPSQSRRQIRAVGLAGQMHGATLLDAADRPLRPAILWNDGRSDAECAELEAAEPRTRSITANAPMAGFTAPKLLWIRKHEPRLFEQIRTVLLPKDYVRLRMTGEKATDAADASGTQWLDVGCRDWSSSMLDATSLPISAMPRLYEGNEVTGRIRPEIADAWGINRALVVAGGGDNAAAAVGLGVVEDGRAFISLGTSGVVFVCTDTLRAAPNSGLHAFCHALPDRWHQMSVMLSAAASLEWAAVNLLGAPDVATLLALAEQSVRPAPIFLPYLSGERTPHANPYAQAVLFGLVASSERSDVARAILDGVAMGMRDGLDIILSAGSTVRSLTVAGGGSRSRYWARLLAAALERPLNYQAGGDVGPAYGAARLAQIGAEGASVSEVCRPPDIVDTVNPDPQLVAYFAERQPLFRGLYKSVQPFFQGRIP